MRSCFEGAGSSRRRFRDDMNAACAAVVLGLGVLVLDACSPSRPPTQATVPTPPQPGPAVAPQLLQPMRNAAFISGCGAPDSMKVRSVSPCSTDTRQA
jgi:hypothetical protein